jgi:hypothetical protein
MALRLSGRLSVMVATRPDFSKVAKDMNTPELAGAA